MRYFVPMLTPMLAPMLIAANAPPPKDAKPAPRCQNAQIQRSQEGMQAVKPRRLGDAPPPTSTARSIARPAAVWTRSSCGSGLGGGDLSN